MARFTGPQHRGATRQLRAKRRLEAEVRNALTPPRRRARRRTADAEIRTAVHGLLADLGQRARDAKAGEA